MKQTVKRTPADVLREARRRDSDIKRDRVFRTVDSMKRDGTPITFAAVARAAKVSQWLVYADGVREYIQAGQAGQAVEPARRQRDGLRANEASVRTDLELARQDNRRLRDENDRLRAALRDRLGAELETQSAASLRCRIDELTAANQRYQSENLSLTAHVSDIRAQLAATEDGLAAARTSIRRMIRDHSHEAHA